MYMLTLQVYANQVDEVDDYLSDVSKANYQPGDLSSIKLDLFHLYLSYMTNFSYLTWAFNDIRSYVSFVSIVSGIGLETKQMLSKYIINEQVNQVWNFNWKQWKSL